MDSFELFDTEDVFRIWHLQKIFRLTKSQAHYLVKSQKFKVIICGNKKFIAKQDVLEYYNRIKK